MQKSIFFIMVFALIAGPYFLFQVGNLRMYHRRGVKRRWIGNQLQQGNLSKCR
jgi:hypothetical protein